MKQLTDDWIRSMCKQPWVFETVKQWARTIEAEFCRINNLDAQPAADDKDSQFAKFKKVGWEKECQDTDKLLEYLGIDPALCRTDGGWLNMPRIKAFLEGKAQPASDDANPNAPWLTEAHMLCTDAGIQHGNILYRIKLLREKMADDKTGVEAAAWAAQCSRTGKYGYIWHEEEDVKGWIRLQHQSRDDCTYRGPIAFYPRPQTQAIPAGYALVPVEPTPEMVEAIGVPGSGMYEREIWAAMLSAAPKPEKEPA